MSNNYHGEKPVTKDDIKLAKKHLKATYKLNKSKIKDHQKAMKKTDNSKSVTYNKSHLSGHQDDNSQIQSSMKTVNNLQPIYDKVKGDTMAQNTQKTGTYKGKSNAPGGGGRFKQMTDKGVSPGLAAFIGKKKYSAGRFAKMAAAGKGK